MNTKVEGENPVPGTPIPGEVIPGSAEETAAFEERARRLGWKDKHEFDRPSERWVDAKTFIERGESQLPVLKENFHRLEQQFGATTAANRDLTAQVAALNASVDHLRELAMNAERNAYDKAARDFAAQKARIEHTIDDAASKADVATVQRARTALANLRPPTPVPAVAAAMPGVPGPIIQPQIQVDPAEQAAVQEFVRNERWFRSRERDALGEGDAEATAFAGAHYNTIKQTRPDLSPQQQLAEVKRAVTRRFGELFENPAANRATSVATPSGGMAPTPPKNAGKRWDDMPGEDRAQADKMIADINRGRKDGQKMTREEYAKLYFDGTPSRFRSN